jgi:hypothetical protein
MKTKETHHEENRRKAYPLFVVPHLVSFVARPAFFKKLSTKERRAQEKALERK